jgi:hypothetical protein
MARLRYQIDVPELATARGGEPALVCGGVSSEAFASELREALAGSALFRRWRALQSDPETIDPALAAIDPLVRVDVLERDESGHFAVTTSLPYDVLKQRLRMLIGSDWSVQRIDPR